MLKTLVNFFILLWFFLTSFALASPNIIDREIINVQNEEENTVYAEFPDDEQYKTLENYQKAKLVILNKITAKSEEVEFELEKIRFFGNLSLKIHRCVKDLNPYKPDNFILLTVIENKIDDDPITIFHGWILSSNPSISTLQHPVYEVIAKDCLLDSK